MQIPTNFDIIKCMKEILSNELAGLLSGRMDFVLESYVLNEDKLCVKPVYKFIKAFAGDLNIPEFCLIYCEADDPEEIFISYNSINSIKLENIIREYKNCRIIFHDKNGDVESYYFNGTNKPLPSFGKEGGSAEPGVFPEDDYFDMLYRDFITDKIYHDCGIIAVYDEHDDFAGYLAYYEIAEDIRDVSYIYVGEKFRGLGYGKDLINFFVNKNIGENKISYYSYADGEISANLARSCGFLPCAKRYEYEYKK